MVRDRQEESEDFYPSSVPTLKGKLGSVFSTCLASVSYLYGMVSDSELSYGCSCAWEDWYLHSVVILSVKE